MSHNDTTLEAPASPASSAAQNDKTFAFVTYGLNLATMLLGITCLIAVVLCYVKRGSGSALLESHYRFQIRTFWISLIGGVGLMLAYTLSFALMFIGIGYLLLPVVTIAGLLLVVWFYTRMIMGLVRVSRDEPIRNPASWLFG
ncbi:putative membrane protein [Halomonas campaniensis]|uniref:Putative membrane protein n=1 Tax=Halomonas campaniensis TaxID=213554 RepID=A0A7W5K0K9_9GAMM|nr:hypothetical protein [Halomonas campaniensis]MBB3329744.1 putative membrane protein [Halomonas campaniensis]